MENPKPSDDTGTALESVLHMNTGDGPNSYAANSSYIQRNAMQKVRSILQESVKRVYSKTLTANHFAVADLGCATGPNSLEATAAIIEAIIGVRNRVRKSTPEILVFLNDLPGNDFNSIFVALPDLYNGLMLNEDIKCFVSAMPGSFHGRLFPTKSLHFVHSSMSVHWLSQVPNGLEHNNKGSICIARTSPDSVLEAYLKQFQRDFTLFLRSRAQEIITQAGEMVLTFTCRARSDVRNKHNFYYWEMLSECLVEMSAEGLVEEKDIDSFNLPYYMPSEEEVRDIVEKETSFAIDKLETVQNNIGPFNDDDQDIKLRSAKTIGLTLRAISEPLLTVHFRGGLILIDDLFQRFETKMIKYLSSGTTIIWAFLILSATKK